MVPHYSLIVSCEQVHCPATAEVRGFSYKIVVGEARLQSFLHLNILSYHEEHITVI